ncbi:MAG: hypothetical protein LBQ54_05075 [Planctomycetaceae bacterium]|jgi:hypothetical protein|nr:hypothetical protein [Planctomycetaceae bacterium]
MKKKSCLKVIAACVMFVFFFTLAVKWITDHFLVFDLSEMIEINNREIDYQVAEAVKKKGDVYINLPRMWPTPKGCFAGRRLAPLHGVHGITAVHISAPHERFPLEGMQHLASLPDLQTLLFQDTPFEGIQTFEPLLDAESLQKLEFQNCAMDGYALISLQTFIDNRPDIMIRFLDVDRRFYW